MTRTWPLTLNSVLKEKPSTCLSIESHQETHLKLPTVTNTTVKTWRVWLLNIPHVTCSKRRHNASWMRNKNAKNSHPIGQTQIHYYQMPRITINTLNIVEVGFNPHTSKPCRINCGNHRLVSRNTKQPTTLNELSLPQPRRSQLSNTWTIVKLQLFTELIHHETITCPKLTMPSTVEFHCLDSCMHSMHR
jgi:hypothetical protein